MESKALDIMKGEQEADNFAGWTIDNTRTNMAALQILAHERPKWINCGCIAHGLALAMKDLCRCFKTRVCNSKTWGAQWIATVNDATNFMANYLNNSGAAKALLDHYQIEVYGKKLSIDVSVPTRFATNLFVMRSIQRSKAALVQAASDSEWLSLGGKSDEVKESIDQVTFWSHLKNANEFLQPFSDMIHQIEADRPALGRCYQGLMTLDAHVRNGVGQWEAAALCDEQACSIALQTWERRLGEGAGVGRSGVQELLLPAYTLAFLLDPLYAQVSKDSEDVTLPQVPWSHENAAQELVTRVGGKDALSELQALQMEGWSEDMCGKVIVCAGKKEATGKSTTNHVTAVKMRKGFWKRFGRTKYPSLSEVALRVMGVHPTSAATERNWSLWGRVHTSARNALGLERAKKMITFCFNDRAKAVDQDDFGLLLSVVEGEVVEVTGEQV
jgi:hypothetical protein